MHDFCKIFFLHTHVIINFISFLLLDNFLLKNVLMGVNVDFKNLKRLLKVYRNEKALKF